MTKTMKIMNDKSQKQIREFYEVNAFALQVQEMNKSEMNVIANDVLDCLNKAKELFFKQYNQYAKSIEVVKSANTSTNMIVNNYSQKVSA